MDLKIASHTCDNDNNYFSKTFSGRVQQIRCYSQSAYNNIFDTKS